MNDYSTALIDARKQLANAEAAAALHDWAKACDFTIEAMRAAKAMLLSLGALNKEQYERTTGIRLE